jgi:hypothetical protein
MMFLHLADIKHVYHDFSVHNVKLFIVIKSLSDPLTSHVWVQFPLLVCDLLDNFLNKVYFIVNILKIIIPFHLLLPNQLLHLDF